MRVRTACLLAVLVAATGCTKGESGGEAASAGSGADARALDCDPLYELVAGYVGPNDDSEPVSSNDFMSMMMDRLDSSLRYLARASDEWRSITVEGDAPWVVASATPEATCQVGIQPDGEYSLALAQRMPDGTLRTRSVSTTSGDGADDGYGDDEYGY